MKLMTRKDDGSVELFDTRIISAMQSAIRDYTNGDIIDSRDTLADIIMAIDEFTNSA